MSTLRLISRASTTWTHGALIPHLSILLFAITYATTIYGLWIGLDFGTHWDERDLYDVFVASYHSALLLPRWYQYPSMLYWLGLISVGDRLSEVVYFARSVHPEIHFDFFVMRARTLAMLVSSLGGIWIYLALRSSVLFVPALSATAGGAFYLLSWEFGYHARWFAPDLICAQFLALFIFFLVRAERIPCPRHMIGGAAAAIGFATSTKYTAGAALLALWAYVLLQKGLSAKARRHIIVRSMLISAGVYLIVTPGTLVDPIYFGRDVLFQMHHYATGHGSFSYPASYRYDIHGFWPYLGRMWEYLIFALMSPQPAIAAILAMMAAIGMVVILRNSRPLGVALGFLLVFYSVFFSLQTVFIVRNFLLLLPVVSYLAAVGLDFALGYAKSLRMPLARVAALTMLILALGTILGWNAWKQVSFGHSIVVSRNVPLVHQVEEYLAQHSEMSFVLSPRLTVELGQPMRSASQLKRSSLFMYLESELTSVDAKLPSGPWMRHNVLDWVGPREVNLNYYPGWAGHDHAMLMGLKTAEMSGVITALTGYQQGHNRRLMP